MPIDDDDIPIDDPIAQHTRRALDHLAGDATPNASWADVTAGARHTKLRQRAIVAGVGVLFVGGIAVAVAASGASAHHSSVVVADNGATTTAGTDTSTTEPNTSTSVAPTEATTAGTTGPSASLVPGAPPTGCGGCTDTTAAPNPPVADSSAHAGDFSGTMSVTPATTEVGQATMVELKITNITDHEVDPSNSSLPTGVGMACTTDFTSDGQTNQPLVPFQNFWFVTNPPIGPGQNGGAGAFEFTPTADDVGTVTCEGVIISSPDGWHTIVSEARLINVAPVTVTVADATATTTTTAG